MDNTTGFLQHALFKVYKINSGHFVSSLCQLWKLSKVYHSCWASFNCKPQLHCSTSLDSPASSCLEGQKEPTRSSSLRIKGHFSLFGLGSRSGSCYGIRTCRWCFHVNYQLSWLNPCWPHCAARLSQGCTRACVSWDIPRDDVPGLRCWGAAALVLLWQVCFVSRQAFSLAFAWGKQQATNKCGLNQKHLQNYAGLVRVF